MNIFRALLIAAGIILCVGLVGGMNIYLPLVERSHR
jgi:hypothetical protein